MFSAEDSLIVLALLVAATGLIVVAQAVRIPYPILLVLGGLALGLVPGMPEFELPPDLVLVAVLPPLLYGAAFFTSLREFRANLKPIVLLAIGLVLLTMVLVAVVAHAVIPGISWPVAFVLGAIVSPTDPTAATSIAQRLGLPRRLVGIIEGESLINDGTALVAYRYAVVAVVAGSFSLPEASGRFVVSVAGGIAVGVAVAWVIRQVRLRIDNPPVEITISILSGYFAFLPAHALDVSGVLAAVSAGIYLGWHTLELTSARTRLQGIAVWEIIFFVLNGLLFTLVGLQLPVILDALSGRSAARLMLYAVLVTRRRDRRPLPLGLPGYVPAPAPSPGGAGRRRRRPVEGRHRHRLVGHARRRLPGRGARLAADDRRRHPVPQPRADHLPHLLGHPRHAAAPGPDPADAHPHASAARRRAGGQGGGEGAHLCGRGGARPARGARGRGLGPR